MRHPVALLTVLAAILVAGCGNRPGELPFSAPGPLAQTPATSPNPLSRDQSTIPSQLASAQPAIVVDNGDAGFSILDGDWGVCADGDCEGVSYGGDFRFADPECVRCRARFELRVANAGSYNLYAWWPRGADRATDTPFTIQSTSQSGTLAVDQRNNGSTWFGLATLAVQAGENVTIVVGSTPTGYANADAIALVPVGSVPPSPGGQAGPAATARPESPPPLAPPTQSTAPPPAAQPGGKAAVKVIFLHHSTGAALIEQGGVRARLTSLGYEFYDHGYNDDGLTLADGSSAGINYAIPDDNTNPDGFNVLFAQPVHVPPDNAYSHLLQYDVIAFKSCFPVSDIQSDDQLAEYKGYYRNVRAAIDRRRDKLFVVVTQPPLVPSATTRQDAARARAFANWLKSAEYLAGHPNMVTFDLFDLLAENNPLSPDQNMLRAAYRSPPDDSHPNARANQTIGPAFADFIAQAIKTHSGK